MSGKLITFWVCEWPWLGADPNQQSWAAGKTWRSGMGGSVGWSLSTPRMNWKSRQPPGKWIECRTRPVFSRRICLDRGQFLEPKVSRG